jgi:flagellar hook-length control protein FliK
MVGNLQSEYFSKRVGKSRVLTSNLKKDSAKTYGKSVLFQKDDEANVQRKLKPFFEKDVDTVFTRYEKWAKPLELKPHYQNIKNADGNFNDIVRQFTLLLQKGGGEAKLVLQPEHLGSLKMKIQLKQGEVITSVLVDNQAVKDLILSRLTILEENLLRHGFNLGSFDVDVKGEEADSQLARRETRGEGVSPVEGLEPDEQTLESFPERWLPWISTAVNITV